MDNQNKNSLAEDLKKEIMVNRKNKIFDLGDDTIKLSDEFCESYKKFLDESKTEREFVENAVKLAEEKGFTPYERGKNYKAGEKIYCINRNKSMILCVIGKTDMSEGVKISASHIDSPRLDLKPNPLYEKSNLALFKTHYYGGIKKYQWTTIPLSIHGKVVKKNGESVDVVIGEEVGEPCFCVTDLLPHLAKDQMAKTMTKAFTGEDLNVLIGSRPFKGDSESELVKLNVMNIINKKYGIVESDFYSAELELVPSFKAVDIGFDRSMIGSYGQDDRVCAYTALRAILDCENPENTAVTILADKEEIGSDGNTGMKSSFFKYFIEDLAEKEGLKLRHVLSNSKCLSADVNAAFDPTYAMAYDPMNSCFVNNGVVITKYTGSGGKYGTSDASAEFMSEVRNMLDSNDIAWQTGELGKVDIGGGGTVAKFLANMNIDVVDLGVPVLSMHAPMEVVSKTDVYMAYKAFKSFNG